MRLDKFLADAGLGSRSQVKELIKKGKIAVDGTVCKSADFNVNDGQSISCNGEDIKSSEFHYYMLNKPAGVITATEDKKDKTVMDLMKGAVGRNLFAAGRLDKDTEGLLLITDDGALSHRLLSPKYHVDKMYEVTCEGDLSTADIEALENGMDIGEDRITLPAKVEVISFSDDANASVVHFTIKEGMFHQVKRMFEKVDHPVIHLKRLTFGPLSLDKNLAPGQWRELSSQEIHALNNNQKTN